MTAKVDTISSPVSYAFHAIFEGLYGEKEYLECTWLLHSPILGASFSSPFSILFFSSLTAFRRTAFSGARPSAARQRRRLWGIWYSSCWRIRRWIHWQRQEKCGAAAHKMQQIQLLFQNAHNPIKTVSDLKRKAFVDTCGDLAQCTWDLLSRLPAKIRDYFRPI